MWEGMFAIIRIITAIITGVIGPFIIWWLKENYGDEEEETSDGERTVTEEIEFAEQIFNELRSIQEEIGCDRVWISQFHNGGKILKSGYNTSMKKISITHEVTGRGISKEKYKINGILVSFFSKMLKKIIDKEHVGYDCNNDDIDPEVRLLLRERWTKHMDIFAMKNIDGVLIGIMGIDFTTANRNLTEQEIQYLKVKASLLAGYMVHGNVNIPQQDQ